MPGWTAINEPRQSTSPARPSPPKASNRITASAESMTRHEKSGSSHTKSPARHTKTIHAKRIKGSTRSPGPAIPANTSSPAARSIDSIPSPSSVLRTMQGSQPQRKPETYIDTAVPSRASLTEPDRHTQCESSRVVLETAHRCPRRTSEAIDELSSRSSPTTNNSEDDPTYIDEGEESCATADGKWSRRRVLPVREVKLLPSIEQAPKRSQGHNRSSSWSTRKKHKTGKYDHSSMWESSLYQSQKPVGTEGRGPAFVC